MWLILSAQQWPANGGKPMVGRRWPADGGPTSASNENVPPASHRLTGGGPLVAICRFSPLADRLRRAIWDILLRIHLAVVILLLKSVFTQPVNPPTPPTGFNNFICHVIWATCLINAF